MQRIGRVDRRMNPDIGSAAPRGSPGTSGSRGKVIFWNFLPPEELNDLLSLYHTVTGKVLMISSTLGIEGKKLLTPDDDYQALLEFTHQYEGTRTPIEDLHLEFQSLIQDDPGLEEHLAGLPGSLFSGRRREGEGVRVRSSAIAFRLSIRRPRSSARKLASRAGTTSILSRVDLGGSRSNRDKDPIQRRRHRARLQARARRCSSASAPSEEAHQELVPQTHRRPVGVEPRLVAWMEVCGG